MWTIDSYLSRNFHRYLLYLTGVIFDMLVTYQHKNLQIFPTAGHMLSRVNHSGDSHCAVNYHIFVSCLTILYILRSGSYHESILGNRTT